MRLWYVRSSILLFFLAYGCEPQVPPEAHRFVAHLGLRCYCDTSPKLGSEIPLQIEIANLENENRSVLSSNLGTFIIELYDKDGTSMRLTNFGKNYDDLARGLNDWDPVPVASHSVYNWTVDLNRLFEISRPGQYHVIVRKNIDWGRTNSMIGAATTIDLK